MHHHPCGPPGAGLKLEPAAEGEQMTYDEGTQTVRIPLKELTEQRRTKLVMFTCNKCGACAASAPPPAAQRGRRRCRLRCSSLPSLPWTSS